MQNKCLLVAALWSNSLFTLSLAFQGPLHSHNIQATRIASKTTNTALYGAPEPLGEEGTWQAYLDEETTGLIYYFDTATGESRWEPPTGTFPVVRLPRKKQRLADNLRREYRKARKEGDVFGQAEEAEEEYSTAVMEQEEEEVFEEVSEEEEQPSGGWFTNIFGDSGEVEEEIYEEAEPVEEIMEEETAAPTNFFDGFFGGGSATVYDEGAVVEEEAPVEEKKGAFNSFFTPAPVEEKIIDTTPKPIQINI